jgi:hypothetical protein
MAWFNRDTLIVNQTTAFGTYTNTLLIGGLLGLEKWCHDEIDQTLYL